MENNFFNIFLFREISLFFLTIVLLLIGLFQKRNSFKNINNLSIITLVYIGLLIILGQEINLANYKMFFSNSEFINFFKLLVIIGSFATLIISKDYFIDL